MIHSFTDIEDKYVHTNNLNNATTQIIPINNDLQQNDIEHNEINECVICFEPVTDPSETSKFGCVHAKYMHDNCVKSLRQCPLCRETAMIVESSIHRWDIWKQYVICFLIGCGFSSILFTAMYPTIFLKFGNYTYNNTITNTTLDNYTYY